MNLFTYIIIRLQHTLPKENIRNLKTLIFYTQKAHGNNMDMIICYFIIYIIEALILWNYCSNLFHSKYTKFREWLILIPIYFLLFLICTLHENILLNLITFLTANFLYIVIIFKQLNSYFQLVSISNSKINRISRQKSRRI